MEEIVESASDEVFDQMESGKFYDTSEMSFLIFKKRLFTRDAMRDYVAAEYKSTPTVSPEEIFAAIVPYLRDLAFVEAFLWSNLVLGRLALGFKNNKVYYSKKK